MPADKHVSRRRFLKQAASTMAAAVAVPYVVPASALGRDDNTSPSNRIVYGLIGCGHHGAGWNLGQIFRMDDAQVIAVCDVDQPRLHDAKTKVRNHYARKRGKNYKGCAEHGDFRDLINRRDIDVVANCTPDHWHVIPAIMAAKAGKDIICEKPLTLTVAEGRTLCDVIKKTGRIFQTASENRSIETCIQLCELVRAGRIGRLKHINVTLPGGNETRGANFMQRDERPVPEGFNYDMWLGQAPVKPYVPAQCHGSFRWCLDYSGGRMTDWGAHLIDLAQWGNNTEATGPVEVEGKGEFPPKDSVFNTTPVFDVNYRYANGVTMNVSSSVPGIRFEGTDGWIGFQKWRGPLEASDKAILESVIAESEQFYRPSEIAPRRSGIGGEHRNFVDCVKLRKPCYAPAETGHRTITIAHIGTIAMLLGRKLRWNPEKERFVDDAEADKMLSRTQREPWTIANIDSWIKENA